MTPKQKEVIERARKQPARFLEIPRESLRFYTAHDNWKKKRAEKDNQKTTELLEKEQERLIKTWNK